MSKLNISAVPLMSAENRASGVAEPTLKTRLYLTKYFTPIHAHHQVHTNMTDD